MHLGESDRPTREQRQQSYNDARELTEYIFWNYREYLTTQEQLAEKKIFFESKRRTATSRVTEKLSELSQQCDSAEVDTLLAQGVMAFRNKVRDRILSEHGDRILINRCAKCNRIVATPRAQQCLWCGYDWHQQTPLDQS